MIASASESWEQVYWTLNDQNQIMGTRHKEHASLFQLQPAGTNQNPNEFLIRYEKHEQGQNTLYYYLKFDGNLFGFTTKPLQLSSELGDRFTLQSPNRVPYLCTHLTRTLQDWREGQTLYVKGLRHSLLMMNGYVGMKSLESIPSESHYTHETVGVSALDKKDRYTLFSLLPQEESRVSLGEDDSTLQSTPDEMEQTKKPMKDKTRRAKKTDSLMDLPMVQSTETTASSHRNRAMTISTVHRSQDKEKASTVELSQHQAETRQPLSKGQRRPARKVTFGDSHETESEEKHKPQHRARSSTVSAKNRDDYKRSPRGRPRSSSVSDKQVEQPSEAGGGKLQRTARPSRAKTISASEKESV